MKFGSVCSGIEAASVAWHPLGWEAAWLSEIEPFPCAVLKHHYPDVPNLGDMTKFKEWQIESNIDVLVGGTPCQSFSVAGLRKGLDDPRGNLMLTYLAIAKQHRPRWLVWENVPGVLSSADGRDFGSFLGGLAICGYGFAYRVLDAQYFGVAQRRKRVFVIGYLGDWRPAAAVLFERESLSGHTKPSREARKVTPTLSSSGTRVSRVGFNCEDQWFVETPIAARMTAFGEYQIDGTASSMKARDWKDATDLIAQPIPFDTTQITSPQNGNNPKSGDPCHPLAAGAHPPAIVQSMEHLSAYSIREDAKANTFSATELEVANALKALQPSPQSHHAQTFIAQKIAVRRLTCVECERLQGFPDHYTDIKPKGKPTSDGPRYKALGNSMAVPVMAWIGKRIQEVENIK
jgi:DNA (cytosine-5)-methyltransferase 1